MCLAVVGSVAVAQPVTTFDVAAGASKEISLEGVTRVAVGDDAIADIRVSQSGVITVTGLKAGETQLVTFDGKGTRANYRIKVSGDAVAAAPAPAPVVETLPASVDSKELTLKVGTQKVLSLPSLTRVAVGDPSIADVRHVGKGQLLIVGEGEGKTTLLTWSEKGRESYLVTVNQ